MTEEIKRIVLAAFYNLGIKRKEVEDKIEELQAEKDEIVADNPLGLLHIFDQETDAHLKKLDDYEDKKADLHDFLIRNQALRILIKVKMGQINTVINFDPLYDSFEKFYEDAEAIMPIKVDETYDNLKALAQKSGVQNKIKYDELKKFRESIISAKSAALNLKNNPINTSLMIDMSVQAIKKFLVYAYSISKKMTEYFDKVDAGLQKKMDEIDEKVDQYIRTTSKAKLDDKRKKLEKKDKEISEQHELLRKIDDLYLLMQQHDMNPSKELFNHIIVELYNIGVMSDRDYKKVTYKKVEKADEIEDATKEEKVETFAQITQPEIDSDYFRSKNTLRIICFLGTEGDSIVDDIDSFDKSMKVNAYRRLNHVFDRLVFDENHIARAGGDPDGSTSKFTLALLDTPYNFTYRRYGEKEDRFRFHAIRRHSDLLEKLGYGKGDLVFFGAAGTFVDNDKARVYNEVGSRAVKKLVGNSRPAELQESFRSIEHITRGYIPVELLADSDKAKDFSGKAKGGIDKSIEDGKYILYSELSDASQKNVKKWLDDYFIDQTNTLFKIKDTYKQLKGTSLD